MKKSFIIFTTVIFILGAFTISCKRGGVKGSEKITLDSLHIIEFAMEIENSVLQGDTLFYVDAFDKEYLKTKLQDNSIAFSSLDASFGKHYFERYFQKIGKFCYKCCRKWRRF